MEGTVHFTYPLDGAAEREVHEERDGVQFRDVPDNCYLDMQESTFDCDGISD